MTRKATMCSWLAAAIGCAVLGGCGHPSLVGLAKGIFYESNATLGWRAFEAEHADQRREAVIELSYRWNGLGPAALRAYARIAKTTIEEPTVRCAALRALGLADADAQPHVDDILSALAERHSRHVRWDAAVALNSIPADKAVEDLKKRVLWDPKDPEAERSPDVRLSCARALRNYRRTDVVAVLAQALEDDEDYAVRHEAHETLVVLVGIDRGWDRADWEPDTRKLPPPRPTRAWWDPLGLFTGGGDDRGGRDDS